MTFKVGDQVRLSKNSEEPYVIDAIERKHDGKYASVDMGRYTVRNIVTGEVLHNAPGYLMRLWP